MRSIAPPGPRLTFPTAEPYPAAPARSSGPAAPAPGPIADASMPLPIAARRPWALIIAVLFVDAGLAVSGAWMLSQGLRSADRAPAGQTGQMESRPR
jgi:hypothetical protein